MRKKGASRLNGCSTESSIGPIRKAASRGTSFPRSSSFGSRRRRRPGRSTEPPSYSSASEGDPLLPPELHCSHGQGASPLADRRVENRSRADAERDRARPPYGGPLRAAREACRQFTRRLAYRGQCCTGLCLALALAASRVLFLLFYL